MSTTATERAIAYAEAALRSLEGRIAADYGIKGSITSADVNIHPADKADGGRLAEALGLTERVDFPAWYSSPAFSAWKSRGAGVGITVYGEYQGGESA